MFFQSDVDVDAVCPQVDVVHAGQIALGEGTLFDFPLLGQLGDHRRGQAPRGTEELAQRGHTDEPAGHKPDEPASTPEARAESVQKAVLDDNGNPLGVEDSKGVRIITEDELNQVRQRFHDQLGQPTNVYTTPKGTVENWVISTDPRVNVTYRTYSGSGGPTIDINGMGESPVKRFHVQGEG